MIFTLKFTGLNQSLLGVTRQTTSPRKVCRFQAPGYAHTPGVEDLGTALALQEDAVLPILVRAAAHDFGPPALHRDAPQVVVHPAADEGRLPAVDHGPALVPAAIHQ